MLTDPFPFHTQLTENTQAISGWRGGQFIPLWASQGPMELTPPPQPQGSVLVPQSRVGGLTAPFFLAKSLKV